MPDKYRVVSDHAKMLVGAAVWLLFDLPLAWLLGPATIGLVLATRDQPIGTDYFFETSGAASWVSLSVQVSPSSTSTGCSTTLISASGYWSTSRSGAGSVSCGSIGSVSGTARQLGSRPSPAG